MVSFLTICSSLCSYRQKALQDLKDVKARVQGLLTKVGLLPDAIDAREIEEFCKHAGYVKVIRYRSLEDELINQVNKSEICKNSLQSTSSTNPQAPS
jgi:amyloid beta precursor protein binding protein 1